MRRNMLFWTVGEKLEEIARWCKGRSFVLSGRHFMASDTDVIHIPGKGALDGEGLTTGINLDPSVPAVRRALSKGWRKSQGRRAAVKGLPRPLIQKLKAGEEVLWPGPHYNGAGESSRYAIVNGGVESRVVDQGPGEFEIPEA